MQLSDIEPYTGQDKPKESDKIYKDFEEKMKAMRKEDRDALFREGWKVKWNKPYCKECR